MKVTNPFKLEVEAKRYHEYRPQYHSIPYKLVNDFVGKRYSKSLDVACGTGHSTMALSKYSEK
ncbi:hypothetical protein OAT67_08480 [Bacteriovoracaceae bacterium]|nr:hypothetical protein [Bacteriovoracaceae bacterium]